MGLIKAGIGALGGTLADQWKEFFYCDAMDMDTLVIRGEKRVISTADSKVKVMSMYDHRGAGQGGRGLRRARRIYLRFLHGAFHLRRLSGKKHFGHLQDHG